MFQVLSAELDTVNLKFQDLAKSSFENERSICASLVSQDDFRSTAFMAIEDVHHVLTDFLTFFGKELSSLQDDVKTHIKVWVNCSVFHHVSANYDYDQWQPHAGLLF